MTIGINGQEANNPYRVGVGQYAFELLSELSKLASTKSQFEIYLSKPPLSDMPKGSSNWKYQIFGPEKKWTLLGLQNRLVQEKVRGFIPDVVFTPTHYTPLWVPTNSVISIMDLSFETMPQFFKRSDLMQLKYWTKLSVAQAKKIITISQFSKGEICRIYGIPTDRLRSHHLAMINKDLLLWSTLKNRKLHRC